MPVLTRIYKTLKLFAAPETANPLRRLPGSMVSEIRRLALSMGASKPISSVAVLGIDSESGSSSIASMLAFVLADSGHDVIVFDASLSQSQQELLKVDKDDYLPSAQPYFRLTKSTWPNLRLATPLFTGEAGMKTALKHVLHSGSVVVVDCPATSSSSDALEFAAAAAGVVLVLRAGKTTNAALAECRTALQSTQIKVQGVVVNRVVRPSGPNLA